MRSEIKILEHDVISNQAITRYSIFSQTTAVAPGNKKVPELLGAECSEDLLNYIDWLGLSNDPNFLVLPSTHHYFYDAEEIKNVKTVINLKELNHIKDLKGFLHSIFRILPQKSYFIGSFLDSKKNNGYELRNSSSSHKNLMVNEAVENGIISRIPFLNMLYSLLDSKTNSYMSKASVAQLMSEHGFKVLDITELNGMTYFCTQRVPVSFA